MVPNYSGSPVILICDFKSKNVGSKQFSQLTTIFSSDMLFVVCFSLFTFHYKKGLFLFNNFYSTFHLLKCYFFAAKFVLH